MLRESRSSPLSLHNLIRKKLRDQRRKKSRRRKRNSHRVGRILQRDRHLLAKHHLKPPDVALAPVANEDLLRLQAAGSVEAVADGLAELGPPLLGAVARVACLSAQAGGSVLHGVGDEGRDGLRGVSDPERDDLGVRARLGVGAAATGDLILLGGRRERESVGERKRERGIEKEERA